MGWKREGANQAQMASIERIEEGDGVITVYFNSPYEVEVDNGIHSELPQLRKGSTWRKIIKKKVEVQSYNELKIM